MRARPHRLSGPALLAIGAVLLTLGAALLAAVAPAPASAQAEESEAPSHEAIYDAIERGCRFLAAMQLEKGSWDHAGAYRRELARRRYDPAEGNLARIVAGLPDPQRDRHERSAPFVAGRVIEALHRGGDPLDEDSPGGRGIAWLLRLQEEDGSIGYRYGPEPEEGLQPAFPTANHAATTRALALATMAAPSPERREALERAARQLRTLQNPGLGFGRVLRPGRNDTWVTSYAGLALAAAAEAGAEVPGEALEGIEAWFGRVTSRQNAPSSWAGIGYTRPGEHTMWAADFEVQKRERDEQDERLYLRTAELLSTALAREAQLRLGLEMQRLGGRADRALRRGTEAAHAALAEAVPAGWGVDEQARQNTFDLEYWRAGLAALRLGRTPAEDIEAWREAVATQLLAHQEEAGDLAGSWPPDDALSGLCFGRLWSTATAVLALLECVALDEEEAQRLLAAAERLRVRGAVDEAEERLRRILERYPRSAAARTAQALVESPPAIDEEHLRERARQLIALGDSYLANGLTEQAIARYREALDLVSEGPEADAAREKLRDAGAGP